MTERIHQQAPSVRQGSTNLAAAVCAACADIRLTGINLGVLLCLTGIDEGHDLPEVDLPQVSRMVGEVSAARQRDVIQPVVLLVHLLQLNLMYTPCG